MNIANRSFENVSQFKHLGMTVTNKNCFMKKLRGDRAMVMLATIQSRTFSLPICCQLKN
jgi:hypothetical protein